MLHAIQVRQVRQVRQTELVSKNLPVKARAAGDAGDTAFIIPRMRLHPPLTRVGIVRWRMDLILSQRTLVLTDRAGLLRPWRRERRKAEAAETKSGSER